MHFKMLSFFLGHLVDTGGCSWYSSFCVPTVCGDKIIPLSKIWYIYTIKSKLLYNIKWHKRFSVQFLLLPWHHYFCWRQHFCKWRHKYRNYITCCKMTSLCRIFIKRSENVSLINIVLWCKYEVICIIQTEVMNNSV